jgi:hypothetical protein
MSSTPLLTDASRLSASQNVDYYAKGVSSHINADWAGHYQIQVIDRPWVDSCGNTIPNSSRLRIPLTANGSDFSVVLPIVPFSFTGTNASAPTITTQPVSVSCNPGGSVGLFVIADGSPILEYQWFKNGNKITGATSNQFAITNANQGDIGDYYCSIYNIFGQVNSHVAVVAVSISYNVNIKQKEGGFFSSFVSAQTFGVF